MNFVSDLVKEVTKDVNGQRIFLFPISEIKTKTHEVYNEAIEKIFDNPIAIDAMVSANYHENTKIDAFGPDQVYKLEVYVQYRDLVDKGVEISLGDFFSFSNIFYEITNATVVKNIWGQAEHKQGLKITGTKVRESQFKEKFFGPTDIAFTDPDAVQKTFVQQRGRAETSEGLTGDKRDLQEQNVLEPLSGPKEVSEQGAVSDNSRYGSAFYDES
jgi:hypothetical protein